MPRFMLFTLFVPLFFAACQVRDLPVLTPEEQARFKGGSGRKGSGEGSTTDAQAPSRGSESKDAGKISPLMAERVDELFLIGFLHEALRVSQLDLSQEKGSELLSLGIKAEGLQDCVRPSSRGLTFTSCVYRDPQGGSIKWSGEWEIDRRAEELRIKELPMRLRVKKGSKNFDVTQEREWVYRVTDKRWWLRGRWTWQALPNQQGVWEELSLELTQDGEQKVAGGAQYRAYNNQAVISFADGELLPSAELLPLVGSTSFEGAKAPVACFETAERNSGKTWVTAAESLRILFTLDYKPPMRFQKAPVVWHWQKGFEIPIKDRSGNMITHKREKDYCRLQPFRLERLFVSPLLSLLAE